MTCMEPIAIFVWTDAGPIYLLHVGLPGNAHMRNPIIADYCCQLAGETDHKLLGFSYRHFLETKINNVNRVSVYPNGMVIGIRLYNQILKFRERTKKQIHQTCQIYYRGHRTID